MTDPGSRNRQRAYRQRKARGRLVLRIDVNDVAWPRALISLGLLGSTLEDDKRAIEQATIAFLDRVTIREAKR